MPDDLTTRCLAEVERAMADEDHTAECWDMRIDKMSRMCTCDRDQRLASRLARMLAAGIQELDRRGSFYDSDMRPVDAALRAIAAAREAP